MKYLLVFGSLRKNSKRGFNYNRFGKGSQKYLQDYTLDGFDMHDLGFYPSCCLGKGKIKTELHEVEDSAAEKISLMEKGAGYFPMIVPVEYEGKKINATIYLWNPAKLESYPKVDSGDWA